MAQVTFTQKVTAGIAIAIVASMGGLVASMFRIDAFTGSDAQQMEMRIITRLNECRDETRLDIQELREAGQYHIERLDGHIKDSHHHGAD